MDSDKKALRSSVLVTAYILGMIGVAFVAGRMTAPNHVEEKVVVKTEWKDKVRVEWRDKIVEKTVYVQAKAKNTRVESRETIKPDGTVERERIETTAVNTTTTAQKDVSAEQTGSQTQESQGRQTQITEIKPQQPPDWNVSLLAGASINSVLLPTPYVAGVHVQRRILGPVHLGAWGLTNLSAGISVGFEF